MEDLNVPCKECGTPHLKITSYDGWCDDCVESSDWLREPRNNAAAYVLLFGFVSTLAYIVGTVIFFW